MISFIPVSSETNIKNITKDGDNFFVEFCDGSQKTITSPVQISVEKSSLGGETWFWAIESQFISYWNGRI